MTGVRGIEGMPNSNIKSSANAARAPHNIIAAAAITANATNRAFRLVFDCLFISHVLRFAATGFFHSPRGAVCFLLFPYRPANSAENTFSRAGLTNENKVA